MGAILLQLTLYFADPVRGAEFAQLSMKSQAFEEQKARAEVTLAGEADFKRRFNQLVSAVADFAAVYNETRGTVWPAKKAEALRKAMKDLETAHPAFGK